MISGVYQIINLANGKSYIGSSKNARRRMMEHRARLVKGNHVNSRLQNAWNSYGEGSFGDYALDNTMKKKLRPAGRLQDLNCRGAQMVEFCRGK